MKHLKKYNEGQRNPQSEFPEYQPLFEGEKEIAYQASDEHNNNRKPYCWKKMGPGTYFGQDVTHWLPLPKKPGTF